MRPNTPRPGGSSLGNLWAELEPPKAVLESPCLYALLYDGRRLLGEFDLGHSSVEGSACFVELLQRPSVAEELGIGGQSWELAGGVE